LREKEDQLFDEWKQQYKDNDLANVSIISDGAADPEEYLGSDPKVVFLLKDANADKSKVWDLRNFLKEENGSRTWDVIAQWVTGIRNLETDIHWSDIEQIRQKTHPEPLRSIVGINIKKTAGAGTTKVGDLWEHADRDQELLRKQLALYSADLVICCGSDVTKIATKYLLPTISGGWSRTHRGVWYLRCQSLGCFVAFSHPTARVSSNLLFYGLMEAIREIKGARFRHINSTHNEVGSE